MYRFLIVIEKTKGLSNMEIKKLLKKASLSELFSLKDELGKEIEILTLVQDPWSVCVLRM